MDETDGLTDADHIAVNRWMLSHGFRWQGRVYEPEGGVWVYDHPQFGRVSLTQAAALFAFYQSVRARRAVMLDAAIATLPAPGVRRRWFGWFKQRRPRA